MIHTIITEPGVASLGAAPLQHANVSDAVQVLTTPTLLVDLSGTRAAGVLCLANLGPAPIYWSFAAAPDAVTRATAPPSLTVETGFPLGSGNFMFLDNVGGLALFAIAPANQIAPADTRVAGAFL